MAKIMEFEVDPFEARICISDDDNMIKHVKNFFLYKGNLSLPELTVLAYQSALRYGVTEIQVLSPVVGCKAYARLSALSRGDGSAIQIVQYMLKPLKYDK
ncbi:hypothetical protein [Paenibacillus xylanexedens]|uniref:hypothetical protein n=1 Tax=Paenibacillus xylanexedens TaxID=528191 RepID=UPI00142DF4D0|nr:hypothetical protein [Paenibacillus xylanexedens]